MTVLPFEKFGILHDKLLRLLINGENHFLLIKWLNVPALDRKCLIKPLYGWFYLANNLIILNESLKSVSK